MRQAIDEDRYQEIDRSNVLPGDVILYLAADGDIEHSGIVVALESVGSVPVPMICSKWGTGAERLHSWSYGPYDPTNVRYYRIIK